MSRRQAERWAEQDAAAYQEPPSADRPDPIEQLRRLGELRDQGVLTEEEFAAQKARLLG